MAILQTILRSEHTFQSYFKPTFIKRKLILKIPSLVFMDKVRNDAGSHMYF
jgi:hypothetical protein